MQEKQNKTERDLKYTAEQASQVYSEYSKHLKKNREAIMKHIDLEQWWEGYKKAIIELADEKIFDGMIFEDDILEVFKKGDKISIRPKEYYSQSSNKPQTQDRTLWERLGRMLRFGG